MVNYTLMFLTDIHIIFFEYLFFSLGRIAAPYRDVTPGHISHCLLAIITYVKL